MLLPAKFFIPNKCAILAVLKFKSAERRRLLGAAAGSLAGMNSGSFTAAVLHDFSPYSVPVTRFPESLTLIIHVNGYHKNKNFI